MLSTKIVLGLMWFFWATQWAPNMWRWHVKLPRMRRTLETLPDGPHKARDLRRIDQQINAAWAGRAGTVGFIFFTLALLGFTALEVFLPSF